MGRWKARWICLLLAVATGAAHAATDAPALDLFARFEPDIVAFIGQCDEDVLERGRALTDDEAALAREVGVQHPERVRVLVAGDFPEPVDPQIARFMDSLGPAHPVADTTGYGIQLTPGVATSRRILLHELTHVAQIERLGAAGFWHAYFVELATLGYRHSAFEEQARANERL